MSAKNVVDLTLEEEKKLFATREEAMMRVDPKEKQILEVAESAVMMAGSFIRLMSLSKLDIFQRKKPTEFNRIVTNFDLESERLIHNEIQMYFPNHEIHAEESAMEYGKFDEGKEVVWFVDPLDGTKAFIKGNLAFVSLSVAAWDKNGLIAAAIYNPYTDVLYSACRNSECAFMNKIPLPPPKAFLLSQARVLIDYDKSISAKIQQKLALAQDKGIIGRIFRYDGSIAQHLALIAQGTLDGALFYGPGNKGAYWDIAAAILICEKQGIHISDFSGIPIGPHSKSFDQLVIGPIRIHNQLVKWLKSL